MGKRRPPGWAADAVQPQRRDAVSFHKPCAKQVSHAGSLAEFVRRHDPDRYLCTLFAPAPVRETLFTLYALNHELARANEVTREVGLSLIRLQWWREVVEGDAKPGEVSGPVRAAVAEGRLAAAGLLALIEARELEAEGAFATSDNWEAWLLAGAGELAANAWQALGGAAEDHTRVRRIGAGVGAVGQLRNIASMARVGRCLLPQDLLARHRLSLEALVADPGGTPARLVRDEVSKVARGLLGAPSRWGRAQAAAVLPACLARNDLRRKVERVGERGVGDRAAVLRGWLSGWC